MSTRPSFFSELKRRNVYKVGAMYGVAGWLLVQVATQVFPFFDIPNWVVRVVVLLVILGFPVAAVIAWAFELTPHGLQRTELFDRSNAPPSKKRTWIYVVIISAALSIGLFFVGRYTARSPGPASVELRRGEQSEAATASSKSIAVLPFENLSSDPDNAFFTEG